MTDKMRDDAIREAARNHAGDEYFNADRAYLLVSPYSGRIFDAGFDRGWQAAQAEQSVPEGWIPVSERLPEHNTHVVGLWQYPNGVTEFDIVFYEYDGEWFCESVRAPDYWCALPYAAPPATPQKSEVK